MAVTRTHFRFRIDVIVGHVAAIEDYELVLGTSRLACERWPRVPIPRRSLPSLLPLPGAP